MVCISSLWRIILILHIVTVTFFSLCSMYIYLDNKQRRFFLYEAGALGTVSLGLLVLLVSVSGLFK